MSSTRASVAVASWLRDGVATVIAVNTENRPQQFTCYVEKGAVETAAEVMFEDRAVELRQIPVAEGGFISRVFFPADLLFRPFRESETRPWPRLAFDDLIDAYGVRIYQLCIERRRRPQALNPRSLILDPSFEWTVSPGTPPAVYAHVGGSAGACYFTDSRVALHGRQSLRLQNPGDGDGVSIAPYASAVTTGRTYRFSVWATARRSVDAPALRLTLPGGGKTFPLSSGWRRYSLDMVAGDDTRISPRVALATPGTGWIDLCEFFDISPYIHAEPADSSGFLVRIDNYVDDTEIRYTLDGTTPDARSEFYTGPFRISRTTTVRGGVFNEGVLQADSEVTLHKHLGMGRFVDLAHPYSPRHRGSGPTALSDGILASES